MIVTDLFESPQPCPECGGPAFSDLILAEKKDACYAKVRSRYKVWPSAYASGALVQCRKKGAANWGNKSEGVAEGVDNPYGYEVGQTVKLQDGRQGQVLDIFDDSIEVLLPGGRIVTVDFQDAQVLDEAALVGGHDPSQPGPLDNFEFWQARVQYLYPDAKFIHEKGYRVDPQTGERVPGNVMALSNQAGGEVARYSRIDREFSIKPPQAGAQKPQAQTAVQKPQAGRPQSVLNRVRTQMDQRGTMEEGFFGNMFGGTAKTAPGQLKTYAVYDRFTVYYDSAKEMFVTAGTGEYKDKFRARGFPALSAQGGVNTAIAYGEKMTGGGHQQPRSMDRSVMGGAHESVAEGETDLNWIRNASKEKLDAIAGPRYKKQSDKKDIDPNKKQQPKKGALDLATLRAAAKTARPAGDLDEGSGNIGSAIKSLYQKIYRAGDDEVEYFYNDSPIFAQYWDEYEGDLDSIIAEVDPSELEVIKAELESYVDDANLAEGWKDVVAGSVMALGALGAQAQTADLSGYNTQYLQQVAAGEHARPMVSVDDAKAELQARANGKQQQVAPATKPQASSGYSKEYLQKAADPDRFGRYMISVEKAQELLRNMQEDVAEGKPKKQEADYGADYQDMVARVKKLAGLGPLKTVWDPQKRVYKNVPRAVQPGEKK